MIISVGYRVKSKRGIQFRIWANNVLKEYLLRGYAANQRFERIENDVNYHIGASLKDLGKKWFAFSKIGLDAREIIEKIEKRKQFG